LSVRGERYDATAVLETYEREDDDGLEASHGHIGGAATGAEEW
jgi:hypothetical protein